MKQIYHSLSQVIRVFHRNVTIEEKLALYTPSRFSFIINHGLNLAEVCQFKDLVTAEKRRSAHELKTRLVFTSPPVSLFIYVFYVSFLTRFNDTNASAAALIKMHTSYERIYRDIMWNIKSIFMEMAEVNML